MFKILLVERRAALVVGLSVVIKGALGNADIKVAASIKEGVSLLRKFDSQMVVVGPGINFSEEIGLNTMSKISSGDKKVSFVIFLENMDHFPMRSLSGVDLKGLIDKDADNSVVEEAFRSAINGKIFISEKLKVQLINDRPVSKATFIGLSTRESVVAAMLTDGKSNKQIGEMLNLKPSTISTFKARIFSKLQVGNLIQLANFRRKRKTR